MSATEILAEETTSIEALIQSSREVLDDKDIDWITQYKRTRKKIHEIRNYIDEQSDDSDTDPSSDHMELLVCLGMLFTNYADLMTDGGGFSQYVDVSHASPYSYGQYDSKYDPIYQVSRIELKQRSFAAELMERVAQHTDSVDVLAGAIACRNANLTTIDERLRLRDPSPELLDEIVAEGIEMADHYIGPDTREITVVRTALEITLALTALQRQGEKVVEFAFYAFEEIDGLVAA